MKPVILWRTSIGNSDVKWLLVEQIPHLRRFARALTGDADQADDLVQDSLERALRNRFGLRRKSSIRAWSFRILYREFLSQRRRKKPSSDVDVYEIETPVAASQMEQLQCRDVLDALCRLPADQRAAVSLVALEDVPYDDAARILCIPLGTLRSRLSRGRAALRTLTDYEEVVADENVTNAAGLSNKRVALRRVK